MGAEKIKTILAASLTAQQQADSLVKAALEAGGPDNITAIVVGYLRPHSTEHRQQQQPQKAQFLSIRQSIVLAILCLLILAASAVLLQYTHPRYYVAPDARGDMALYRDWPLLSMLHKERVPIRGQMIVSYEEAQLYLKPDAVDPHKQIDMKEGKEEGVFYLQDLAKKVALGLLDQTKTAADKGDVHIANAFLTRARALGAGVIGHGETARTADTKSHG